MNHLAIRILSLSALVFMVAHAVSLPAVRFISQDLGIHYVPSHASADSILVTITLLTVYMLGRSRGSNRH